MRGIVTGKDVRIGGSEGRVKATGQGVAYCIEDYYADRGETAEGQDVLAPGLRQRGQPRARRSSAGMGARLLAVNDADGTIFNGDGIDVHGAASPTSTDPKNLKRSVAGFPGAQKIEKKDLWEVQADILVPAALGGEITADVAERLKVKLIAEGANGPTTPEADRVLLKRGIDLIPDIIANAGGVTVSYYEWIQNKRMEALDRGRGEQAARVRAEAQLPHHPRHLAQHPAQDRDARQPAVHAWAGTVEPALRGDGASRSSASRRTTCSRASPSSAPR